MPCSATIFTIAEPTITPSAYAENSFACCGLLIPKPIATGTSVTKSGKITFPQPKIKVTVKKKKAIVTWKKLKAAKGYYVYRREAKGKKYTKWKKVKNIKKNTTVKYKDSKLKKGKTYQYKVVAYNNRKNKGTSAIKKIVIK